jgi:hypothetical protein
MLRKTSIIVLFVALGAMSSLSVNAQTNALPLFNGKQYDENKIYQDENGTFRVQTQEKQVWVPEQETSGILGKHTVAGHYETVREQVKVYINRNGTSASTGGYYDQNGVYHPGNTSNNGGYYDQNGVYHPGNTSNNGGYYDQNGVYHPGNTGTNGGYYDQNGVYHPGTNANGKQPGWVGKNPHGMPPGQRKKMSKNGNYNSGYTQHGQGKNKNKHEDDEDED